MVVNQVTKRAQLDLNRVVKYQILTYCYLNGVSVSESDLDCLTYLAFNPDIDLTDFCNNVSDEGIFKTPQSVRNAVTKAEKKDLVTKNGGNRKSIKLNPVMNIQVVAPVMLDYKFLAVESQEV
jgi:hypothetical protein